MNDTLCVGFLLTLYALPVVGLFTLMALLANIIEVFWTRRDQP